MHLHLCTSTTDHWDLTSAHPPPPESQLHVLQRGRPTFSPSPALSPLWEPAESLSAWPSYPFHVVVQSNSHAVSLAQHLTGHQGVEDASAHQGQAEIEAKKPPVLHITVKLQAEERAAANQGKGEAGNWDVQ